MRKLFHLQTVLRHDCRVPVDMHHTELMRRHYNRSLAVGGQSAWLANHPNISHCRRLSLEPENFDDD